MLDAHFAKKETSNFKRQISTCPKTLTKNIPNLPGTPLFGQQPAQATGVIMLPWKGFRCRPKYKTIGLTNRVSPNPPTKAASLEFRCQNGLLHVLGGIHPLSYYLGWFCRQFDHDEYGHVF